MSHRRTVIEPAEGLTILTGPNNCGKSAVVEALRILASNEQGAHKWCVRHGQKVARVVVDTDDPHRIEWVSESGKVHYVIDGVRTDRLNRGLPDQLAPTLKLPEVEGDDGKSFEIHFAPQKDPIFLLGGGSKAATFFAASTDAGYLVRMLQTLRQRKTERNALYRELKVRVLERDEVLERYEPLSEIETDLAACQRTFEETVALDERRRAGVGHVATLEHATEEWTRAQEMLSVMAALSSLPVFDEEEPIRSTIQRIEARLRSLEQEGEVESALSGLTALPIFGNTAELASLATTMERRALEVERLAEKCSLVEGLGTPPELADPADLDRWVRQVERCQQAIDAACAEVVGAGAELDRCLDSIQVYLRAHPQCPVCGGPIDESAVLQGAHVHA